MIELFVRFKNYLIPYEATDSAMIATARLTAWCTRYPHARVSDQTVRRDVESHGSTFQRAILEIRVDINEDVPDDLRA